MRVREGLVELHIAGIADHTLQEDHVLLALLCTINPSSHESSVGHLTHVTLAFVFAIFLT